MTDPLAYIQSLLESAACLRDLSKSCVGDTAQMGGISMTPGVAALRCRRRLECLARTLKSSSVVGTGQVRPRGDDS